ncbi:MAG: MarC family protein [Thermoplasmatota archaeon]
MMEALAQLVVLFFVIFDPLASFAVFTVATAEMRPPERRRTAAQTVLAAAVLSYAILFIGEPLLHIFSVSMSDFKIAGGIVLGIFGLQMSLGHSLGHGGPKAAGSAPAIAAIIATPLLTGPAAITAIIASVADFGLVATGVAVTIVLLLTAALFCVPGGLIQRLGRTPIQFLTVILGMITLAWGVRFIKEGLGF